MPTKITTTAQKRTRKATKFVDSKVIAMAMNPPAQSLMNHPLSTVTANLTKCALAQTQTHLTMRNQTKMRTLTMMTMMSEKVKSFMDNKVGKTMREGKY